LRARIASFVVVIVIVVVVVFVVVVVVVVVVVAKGAISAVADAPATSPVPLFRHLLTLLLAFVVVVAISVVAVDDAATSFLLSQYFPLLFRVMLMVLLFLFLSSLLMSCYNVDVSQRTRSVRVVFFRIPRWAPEGGTWGSSMRVGEKSGSGGRASRAAGSMFGCPCSKT